MSELVSNMQRALCGIHQSFSGNYRSETLSGLLEEMNMASKMSDASRLRGDMIAVCYDLKSATERAKEYIHEGK